MVTEAGDLLNAGEVVEAQGRAWTLCHVGPGTRAKFSAWLKGRARAAVQGDREALNAYTEQVAAGAYNWGSPLDEKGMGSAVQAALGQAEGATKLLQLLLEPRHGELTDQQASSLIYANPEGFGEAVRACLGLGPDPNRATPPRGAGEMAPA